MISLPERPRVSPKWRERLLRLLDATRAAPPLDLASVVFDELKVDLSARCAGMPIPHPFGKASGQLSHKLHQVEADVEAGLAFVVLKTVVAEDAEGVRSMDDWAIEESQMRVERRASRGGREGWTVTWKGRGWAGTLEEYLEFFAQSLAVARERNMPVIPSVQYHLPADGESVRAEEYEYTTDKLLEVWDRTCSGAEMVLEKDMSPTLAGDRRAQSREHVLRWLEAIPELIQAAAPGRVRLGVKLMNALFDDEFQIEMMRALVDHASGAADFLVVFNRLFDPALQVAYGGWDLSDRNLRVLQMAWERLAKLPPLSATGNICSGRVMVEYALRGCENGQAHTFFQLPLSEYTATGGNRSARALHTLVLHPTEGLVVWLRHLHEAGQLEERDGAVRFLDLVERARGEAA